MNKHQDLTRPNSLRSKIRKKRIKHLVGLVDHIIKTENLDTIKICDLGGTFRYWLIFPFEQFKDTKFEITLLNLEAIVDDEISNYKALLDQPNLEVITEIGNGCDMPHKADNSYHLSHSNSVIEHVGSWHNIKNFASESKRIGKYFFMQTPNYWFFMEPHYFLPFVHYFPRPIHTRLLMAFKKRSFDVSTGNFDENRMLTKKEFKFLMSDATMITERFYLLRKSFIATSKV